MLFTYNIKTGGTGVASFCNDCKHIMVFEGKEDGSDDKYMNYDEFIKNYKFELSNEYETPNFKL